MPSAQIMKEYQSTQTPRPLSYLHTEIHIKNGDKETEGTA
jgi:hypothetical protein